MQVSQGLKLFPMARGSTSADIVQLSGSFLTLEESISLLEEKPYTIVFCAYIQAHKHYTYTYIYIHTPHTHLQGYRLECEAERQLYFIEGSVPDLFFCITFRNTSKHSYVDSYFLHRDVKD